MDVPISAIGYLEAWLARWTAEDRGVSSTLIGYEFRHNLRTALARLGELEAEVVRLKRFELTVEEAGTLLRRLEGPASRTSERAPSSGEGS